MAGKESSGVNNSDDKIFSGANFIITPTEKNTRKAIEIIKHLAKILNFKNIATLSVKEHDEIIGFVSQLTHAIAVSLMNCTDNTHLKRYTGDSFRDLTRIAKINENMWSELFFLNKDVLIYQINEFIKELDCLKNTLIENDEDKLKDLFIQSTLKRKKFDE
jgi:prephenate dehydrogenase